MKNIKKMTSEKGEAFSDALSKELSVEEFIPLMKEIGGGNVGGRGGQWWKVDDTSVSQSYYCWIKWFSTN